MFESARVWIAKCRQRCGDNCRKKQRRKVAAASEGQQWAERFGGGFIGDEVRVVGIGLLVQKGPLLPFRQLPCAQNLQRAILENLAGFRSRENRLCQSHAVLATGCHDRRLVMVRALVNWRWLAFVFRSLASAPQPCRSGPRSQQGQGPESHSGTQTIFYPLRPTSNILDESARPGAFLTLTGRGRR